MFEDKEVYINELPRRWVEFTLGPQKNFIRTSEVRSVKREEVSGGNFIEFPGVGSCIPAILLSDAGNILAIHAHHDQDLEDLKHKLQTHLAANSDQEIWKLIYVEIIVERDEEKDPFRFIANVNNRSRQQVVSFLSNSGKIDPRIKPELIKIKTPNLIDNLAYSIENGFELVLAM